MSKSLTRSNSVKISHIRENEYNGDYYSFDDVLSFCQNIDQKYLKKGGQRTLIKNDKKMYFSILKFSDDISQCKGVTFRARVLFVLGKIKKYKCEKCGMPFFWDNYDFYMSMSSNDPHYVYNRSKEHYIELLGEKKGIEKFKALQKTIKANGELHKERKINSLKYYIDKYGLNEGKKRFDEFLRAHNHFAGGYSKISQVFFEKLIQIANIQRDKCFFATNNGEKTITLTNDEIKKLNKTFIKVDFCVQNKIIEFNGEYWHRDTKEIDEIRADILRSKGYDVLIVEEKNDFDSELQRAKDFLNKDRFKIQTADSQYSKFDGIKKNNTDTLTLFFEDNTSIKISYDHRFVVNDQTIYAKDLKIGDYLQKSDKSLIKITNILQSEKTDVYDILETDNHTYITNDIISHNCEFVGSSYTLLSSDKLSSLVSEDYVELKDGKLRIYEYPKKGHQYIMAVDPAKNGIDAFAVQIVDITEMCFRQVACAQLQIDFMLMPEWLDDWGKYYNMAYIIIENNEGAGTYAASTLFKTYEYYNLFWERSRETGKKKREAGFRTTQYSRGLILNTLRLFSDNDKIIIHDSSTIQELYTFALVDGKYQAIEGCHDDMVMSLAIVFAPFADARNFDDMRAITKQIYNKGDNFEGETKNLAHLLNNAVFDDCGDDAIESSPFDDRGDEELGSIGDIRQSIYESSIEDEMNL